MRALKGEQRRNKQSTAPHSSGTRRRARPSFPLPVHTRQAQCSSLDTCLSERAGDVHSPALSFFSLQHLVIASLSSYPIPYDTPACQVSKDAHCARHAASRAT